MEENRGSLIAFTVGAAVATFLFAGTNHAMLALITLILFIVLLIVTCRTCHPFTPDPSSISKENDYRVRTIGWGIASALLFLIFLAFKNLFTFSCFAFCGFFTIINGTGLLSAIDDRNRPHDDTEDWLTDNTPLPFITGDHFVPNPSDFSECIHYNDRTYNNCATCARRGTNSCKYY